MTGQGHVLCLSEIRSIPSGQAVIASKLDATGTKNYVAVRNPSFRTDVAKLTLYEIIGSEYFHVKVRETEDRRIVGTDDESFSGVEFLLREPRSDKEAASADKVLRRHTEGGGGN